MQKNMYRYIILAVFIFIIDRVSKYYALILCKNFTPLVGSLVSCELHFNRGISWGLLHSDSNITFLIVSAIIAFVTALIGWNAYCQYRLGYSVTGQICIITGSLSNLIDRLLYDGVIDFIILSCGDFSWPVFNFADAVIVLGVGTMFLQYEKKQ